VLGLKRIRQESTLLKIMVGVDHDFYRRSVSG
jgi:hypothetical protein